MSKPPKSTPHSDLHGVHSDEKPNVETADEVGDDAGDLARARDEGARPPYSHDLPNRDDRSR